MRKIVQKEKLLHKPQTPSVTIEEPVRNSKLNVIGKQNYFFLRANTYIIGIYYLLF